MKKLALTALFALILGATFAQNSTSLPLHDENHQIMDRLEIKTSHFHGIHSSIMPSLRKDAHDFSKAVDTLERITKSKRNKAELRYLVVDNNDDDTSVHSKKPFLKVFYKTPAHFLEVRSKHFYANVNPILHFGLGYESSTSGNGLLFLNRRGAAIRGNIARKVYFYTDIIDSQARFANYIASRIDKENAIPGAGFYKQYNSSLTPQPDDGFDYLIGQGHISFNIIKQIGVQLGHGTNFIGDGHRSLFLSDFSTNYFYLKINTRVWKLHYQNIYAELIQDYERGADQVLPKKYITAHYLSINILKNLNVGLYEATVFSRDKGFEFQYLNPLILYRAVEQALGSPDNVVLGLSVKYNFLKRFSFYGQFILDEFNFSRMIASDPAERGWWANKYGLQLGIKYIDVVGVDHLDFQFEYNTVRPYTYSYKDSTASYTHYNQPLAHPLGANFQELIAIISYQPIPKLNIRAQVNYAMYGQDTSGSNWGTNVHLPYGTYEQEFGNKTKQGVRTNSLLGHLWLSYQIRHNLFADLHYLYRREDAVLDNLDHSTHALSIGLRWNISERLNDF